MPPGLCLVCFAVKEEAAPFRERIRNHPDIEVLVTGMGTRNAESGLKAALALAKPVRVITSGFAGGLDPGLKTGQVVAEGLDALDFPPGALPIRQGRFHCAERVAVTASEKAALRASTGADGVEMESGVIRRACATAGVSCAIVRVILDEAGEDLPLDFNSLLNDRQEIDSRKLAGALLRHPGKLPDLMRFQKRVKHCAETLGEVLASILGAR